MNGRTTGRTTGWRAASGRSAPCRPRPWCSSKAWARDAERCGRFWRACCGWSPRPRTPGREAGSGMVRSRATSGKGGSSPSAATSPMTLLGPLPISWCGGFQRGLRCLRDLLGLLDQTRLSRTVTGHRLCAEPVKRRVRELPQVLQLGLTGGPYRSYVSNVRLFGVADRREAPGCSPVIGGFVLSSFRIPDALRHVSLTLGHRAECAPCAPTSKNPSCGHSSAGPHPAGTMPLGATFGRLLSAPNAQLPSTAQRFDEGCRRAPARPALKRGHGMWGT